MNFSKIILIGCLLFSPIFAHGKQHTSEKIFNIIQSKAGVWGLLAGISSAYALIRINKFIKDLYYDYTLKDYGNFWTEKELRQLRIDHARGHLFQHLPYVVIPLLMVKLCTEEAKLAMQNQKKK